MSENLQHLALWWEAVDGGKVECLLCPRRCVIADNCCGFCGVRQNHAGKLYSLAYGSPMAINVDPIEKKPLAEFMPGTTTFSIGTFGCNLNCNFCQNWTLSRGNYAQLANTVQTYSPETLVELALKRHCKSIAFTYNEPTVFAEYVIDTAKLTHDAGLATVLVSNGYISDTVRGELYPLIDAANIDMKGFSEEFYRSMTGTELAPILESIKYFYSLGHHLELTNLVIPGKNDSEAMINGWLNWIEEHLDKTVPLHFSAFHPDYKLNKISRTSAETLCRIKDQAKERGFISVYLGNI
ncbi:MAG: AmmeMemoRadiSam system radical SAM enzyme [Victivallaceae bacterium]|nr:AmmeMemoRadiSam system radical SAM enzyme [Victivallaceae bacterium]